MTNRGIVVSAADEVRLRQGINMLVGESNTEQWESVRRLEEALLHAERKERSEIPEDVVTMNSMVLLRDMTCATEKVFTLVYPSCDGLEDDMVSVLAPLGTALLGAHTGDEVEYEDGNGSPHKVSVLDVVYQPEAAGHKYL